MVGQNPIKIERKDSSNNGRSQNNHRMADLKRNDSNKQDSRGDGTPGAGGRNQRFQGQRKGNFNNRGPPNSQQQNKAMKMDPMEDHDEEDQELVVALSEKKFTGRCRLFVGNLTNDTTEDEFKKMFEPFGEFTEVYLNNGRGFGFIRMDTRVNAEAAKNALDGTQRKGRMLRVRFATHGAALKVKHLSQHVTNELLAEAFSMFGELERAVVIADDRGKSTGEGIVEFARKPGAQAALKRINDGVFLLTGVLRPIAVEPLEQTDEQDGVPEKFVSKNADFNKDREQPPRFAQPGAFEYEFAQKWKDLYMMHKEQEESLKRQFDEAVAKLEMEQSSAQIEHQTALLRQDLMRRQEELRRLEEQHQMDMQRRMEMRRNDDDRRRQDDERRRQEMEMRRQEEMRQQELYAQQERALREMRGDRGGAPPMQPPPAPPAGLGLERGRQGSAGNREQGMGNNMSGSQALRQSRFDQPPNFQGGNMGGGNIGGGMMGNMGRGPMGNERGMMDRRREGGGRGGDEFFENKRARRF